MMKSLVSQKSLIKKLIILTMFCAFMSIFILVMIMMMTGCTKQEFSNTSGPKTIKKQGDQKSKRQSNNYMLVACKDYRYGNGPRDFGITNGTPHVTCGSFSAGGPEGNLYILDLVNKNVKVLRKSDAALLKVIKLPSVVFAEDSGFPWYIDFAVDKNGTIYVLATEANRSQVIAFDETGRLLSIHFSPEGFHRLIRTREGQVVVASGDQGFFECSFMGRRYQIKIKGNRRKVLELIQYENSAHAKIGRYIVTEEETIFSAGFIGEDGFGNTYAWVQTGEMLQENPKSKESLKLSVLQFSKDGDLLNVLFVPEEVRYTTWIPKFFDVFLDGTIYQVIPGKEFLKVCVWAPSKK